MMTPPVRPRGGPVGRFDGPPRDIASPPGAMRGRTSLTYRAPGYRAPSFSEAPPPSGPRATSYGRGDFSGSSRGDVSSNKGGYSGGYSGRGAYQQDLSFRGNSSTSTTYPRTQRFNSTQQHLAGLEKIIPGGKKLPSGLSAEQEKRMNQLEEEAEKMRSELAEKQKSKREALSEWEVRERESELAGLRSELAEEHLHKLSEEDTMVSAAF